MGDEEQGRERGGMWSLDQIDQPLGDDAARIQSMQAPAKRVSTAATLRLAFLSLGVVYGDIGTSPLYVFSNIFPDGIQHREDVLGALSLIVYTITLIALVKYVFIALRSGDNGEGGTFALYSLICRHVKVNTISNQHPTDRELTTYSFRAVPEKSHAHKVKVALEKSQTLQKILLVLVLLGTSMVIGDGMLSPAISVLSSVRGLRVAHLSVSDDAILVLALVILVGLFCMQRIGTARVGFMFAPIIFVWFLAIGALGVYNIVVHDPSIFKALNPHYIIRYFGRQKTRGWESLGGVFLAITGAEALFADLGHFSASSIQLAFTGMVFPCLLAAYMGQAAYLMKLPDDVNDAFYKSIPKTPAVYWPVFVIATASAVIASQATISATFSIIKQAVALGCFPRVKIVHTSYKYLGQVYIPEVNWLLMVACLVITAGFRETMQIANAYGIAVVGVMLVTTLLMALVMLIIWQRNLLLVLAFLVVFGSLESTYISAVLVKVEKGGWVPLAIGAFLLIVMYTWHYGTTERHSFELQNKVSLGWILRLGPGLGMVRLPGIGLFYTELAHGVPSIFSHFLTHFPAIHSILMFVCVKYLPVSTVPKAERFHIRRIGPREFRMYRCAVRYGYKDLHKKDDEFDELLFQALRSFVRYESMVGSVENSDDSIESSRVVSAEPTRSNIDSVMISTAGSLDEIHRRSSVCSSRGDEEDEGDFLGRARQDGIVHIMGNTVMKAREASSFWKRVAINFGYSFLRRICRGSSVVYHIPHESLLHVGVVYDV
ncbi:potassium transporter 10 isoform X1 [Selaginella moellendorffii]|uniref:potassium transporter 10 isoform X1 n=1 Tax=Selaginella moellendorffii TaxID=88036 RepID=UPI000D1CA7FE|nr:potassium transporter 10 isoform X1 [Selaginella moellendorffii]|eukprot:XP_024527585.1 potassium transporter 10 isoform X1 [Selaginella moellendorffii]